MIASFSIAGAPVAKGRPRLTTVNGSARAYTPAKTRAFEAIVADQARRAMEAVDPYDQAVEVEAYFVVPIPKSWSRAKRRDAVEGRAQPIGRPDLDNYAKALCDAMNGIVYADDSLIVSTRMVKRYGEDVGIVVTVRAA